MPAPARGFPTFGQPQKSSLRHLADNRLPEELLICCAIAPQKGCCRMISNEPFSYRRNKDGTIDSICNHCYLTVGTALNDSELPEIEHSHTCDPEWLLHWKVLSRLSTHD